MSRINIFNSITSESAVEAIKDLGIREADVLREGYKALARRDYALAMKRKDDGRGVFKDLRYLTPEMKEHIMAQRRPVDQNKTIPSVDVAKLTADERWAYDRLSVAQRLYWGSYVEFAAWVRRGCPNSAFPEALRTPKEQYK